MYLGDLDYTFNYHDRWLIHTALEQFYIRLKDDDEKLLDEFGEHLFDWSLPRVHILMTQFKNN